MGMDGRSLYKRVKPAKPMWRFRLNMLDGCYVHVYIWEDEESLYSASREEPPYLANYLNLPHTMQIMEDGEISAAFPQKWGEIHLEHKNYGVGVVAHEIQHAVLDFMDAYSYDFKDSDDAEEICYLVQDMNTRFWELHYQHIDTS